MFVHQKKEKKGLTRFSTNANRRGWVRSKKMFNKLLIANRGEIACRVIRTARQLGIKTVAVYSDADADALHVREADEAVYLGPAAATESYLNKDALLGAIRETGADAVHPGYGFFSENADFAETVREAGVAFVGPPAQAVRDMGAKDNAKAIMEKADVPVVPGYYGEDQSTELFAKEAERIGYPVLLKAALGGGGKGMRVVNGAGELEDGIASATREAESAFGDGRLLVEKYLTGTRHVEVQVFADSFGNCIHLFERDCSLQRRHQKIIEEAPAPGLSDQVRKTMGAAAVRAAKAVNYEGAGTVEFLLAPDDHFYFMEMNTRLQVEHPVTELITGTDLVEWQLRVADGEKLPAEQDEIILSGHAIEARLYAEDPANGFMPAPGTLHHLRWPETMNGIRIDTGVQEGDIISPHYDPMIAKMICFGKTRNIARQGLLDALNDLEVVGPGCNSDFLKMLLDHKVFVDAGMDTAFVDGMEEEAFANPSTPLEAVVAAALHVVHARETANAVRAEKSNDPYSPWNQPDCWRMNDSGHQDLLFQAEQEDDLSFQVSVFHDDDDYALSINGAGIDEDTITAASSARVINAGGTYSVFGLGASYCLTLFDPILAAAEHDQMSSSFAAPMPGKIAAVEITDGQEVCKGDVLVVVEAMKMEHAITAPRDGTVDSVLCKVGDQVDEGHELLIMAD
jgi:3-methylcrotonyl-CoA carboxylase alpha subunit